MADIAESAMAARFVNTTPSKEQKVMSPEAARLDAWSYSTQQGEASKGLLKCKEDESADGGKLLPTL